MNIVELSNYPLQSQSARIESINPLRQGDFNAISQLPPRFASHIGIHAHF